MSLVGLKAIDLVPSPNENGTAFAKRLMAMRYLGKSYSTGAGSEFSKIKKFGDRGFKYKGLK